MSCASDTTYLRKCRTTCGGCPGEAGPAGADGPAGPTGPTGPTGTFNSTITQSLNFNNNSITNISTINNWPILISKSFNNSMPGVNFSTLSTTVPVLSTTWLAIPQVSLSLTMSTLYNNNYTPGCNTGFSCSWFSKMTSTASIVYYMSYNVNTQASTYTGFFGQTNSTASMLQVFPTSDTVTIPLTYHAYMAGNGVLFGSNAPVDNTSIVTLNFHMRSLTSNTAFFQPFSTILNGYITPTM